MAAAKKTAPARKRKVISYKDVQIAYLLDGVEGVDKLIRGRRSAGSVVKRALRELKAQGKDATTLEDFVAERFGRVGRGRSVPRPGEERKYKAQQLKSGVPFLRLPLNTLAIQKGKQVRVRFEEDKIIVAPA